MELWNDPLTYYCEPGREPFCSITALPREKALLKAAELAPTTRSPKNRFCAADFPGYYEKRLRTEEWLYGAFLAKGGEAETRRPLYFVLGESVFLHEWFGRGTVYTFDLRDVPLRALSFTLGDSMSVVDRRDRAVLTADELSACLAGCGLETLRQKQGIHYVEAQLWTAHPPEPRRVSPEDTRLPHGGAVLGSKLFQ